MKQFNGRMAAQGDILVESIDKIPAKATEAKRVDGQLVVGLSETSHNHSIHEKRVTMLQDGDPFTCYLRVEGEYADLVHHRGVNPHETIRLPAGNYRIRRQREWTPEGWRAVQD